MPTDNRARTASPNTQQDSHAAFEIRTVQDARDAFALFLDDERELNSAATTFFKLGGQLAGRSASRAERDRLLRESYERIVRDPATKSERTRDEKAGALRRTISEMRERNFVAQASPAARRAHAEIDGFVPATDDLRASFTVPEGSSRAEHASRLSGTNSEARDLFERGATLYGDTLVIPLEAGSAPDPSEQIRLGTLAHAVREFEPLVGDAEARLKAAEFVQLGRDIAGSTADGDTRLVVFRAFYQDIKRDESGNFRSREEQSARLEGVLERMRELAAAMRAEEWQRAPVEIVSLDEWERGLEERQREAEIEAHGRLTYRLEEALELETDDESAAQERDRLLEQSVDRNFVVGASAGVDYERVRLNELPPRLPEGLTREGEARLRYEVIPHLDRQLETGARPADILRGVVIQADADERRSRETEIAHILTTRAPAANREHPLNRAEEAVALYTLRALRSEDPASDTALNEEFARRALLPHERAAAIDTVGARLAQDYRGQNARLNTFASLERERARLQEEAARFREQVRATPEFQNLLETLRAQERDNNLSEHEALERGNSARAFTPETERSGYDSTRSVLSSQTAITSYPELVGESRPPSDYAALREKNERANHDLRQQLTSLLVNPEIEQALAENARRIEESGQHFRGQTGRDMGNATEAREALAPELRWMRATLDHLAGERASINVGRTRPMGEKQINPLYVGLPEHPDRRLAVESVNEFRTLTSVAESLDTKVLAFTSLRGREITGASEERELELNFARDYVSYRQLDDTTRKLNEHRLFREYNARLGGALSASELLATIKEIRQDNYARAQHPERYRDERDAARRQGEQARRPLTEREMQQLFLDLTPAHFTEEMRAALLNHSGTARDKAERIKGLENGSLAPSASLRLLLAEFARTRSEDLARFGRNIRSFLADYLNPPAPNRLRFSAYNLYGLREKLSPAERDYFFKVVNDARQSVISGGFERRYDSRRARASAADERAGHTAPGSHNLRHPLDELRDRLEERVSNYLMSVVRERGVQSLESDRESPDHAAQVARIIKDTITGRGHELGDFSLDDARVAAVSGKLVGELPYALAASRSRDFSHELSTERSALGRTEQVTRVLSAAGQQPTKPEFGRAIDDEIVEQKVSLVIGQITGQGLNRHDSGRGGIDGHRGGQNLSMHDIPAGRNNAAPKHTLVR
jgi:hypothetical protein